MGKKSVEEKPTGMRRKAYGKELRKLQAELCHLQAWVKHKGLRVIVIFDGRDAAGKGGTIREITARVSPRIFQVVALAATDTEYAAWVILRSDDKRRARLNGITHLLSLIPYEKLPQEKTKLPKISEKDGYKGAATLECRKFVPEVY